ncbi:MAG: hypothetical protein H7Z41_11350 [Cytophagales bacterium]|nr:hypothetical protein [Armatimonadota bacterium]
MPDYAQALASVEELLAIDNDIIKKLRRIQPTIAYITAEQIQQVCPAVPDRLAVQLAAKFTKVC